MATFLPGVTDSRPEQHLYQPDYNFLGSVMGAEQQKYDEGFSKVKTIYSSLLNGAISNGQNREWRDDAFKKIETQMRSVSKVDLRQGANVNKAQNIFAPLVGDEDLTADMVRTAQLNAEDAKADAAMNSSDPAVRKTYSDLSRQDIANSRQALLEAKRGDHSISAVRPNKFTAFEDYAGYLSKQAKEQGIEIVKDVRTGDMRIHKLTNGPGVTSDYAEWAKAQAGSTYDAQFQVEARVGLENHIRTIRQTDPQLSRSDALKKVAETAQPMLLHSARQGMQYTSIQMDQINTQLANYDAAARKKGDTLSAAQNQVYEDLQAQKSALETSQTHQQTNLDSLEKGDVLSYLHGNLEGLYADNLKNSKLEGWANSYAKVTAKDEIRTDDVALAQFHVQHEDNRFYTGQKQAWNLAALSRQQDAAVQNGNWARQDRKMDLDDAHTQTADALEYYKLGLQYPTGGKPGKTASSVAAKAPGVAEVIGAFTPDAPIPAVDVVMKSHQAAFDDAYKNAFNVENGAVNLFYHKADERFAVNDLMGKIKKVREGLPQTFDQEERELLTSMGKRFQVSTEVPNTQNYADKLLKQMVAGMGQQAHAQFQQFDTDHIPRELKQSVHRSVEGLLRTQRTGTKIDAQVQKISNLIDDPANPGYPKKQYEGATPLSRDRNGRVLLWNASGIKDPEAKATLNSVVNQEFLNQTGRTGTSYILPKPSVGLLTGLLNANEQVRVEVNGENITADVAQGKGGFLNVLQGLSGETLQKALGESLTLSSSDGETSTFVLKVDPSSELAKGKGAPLLGGGTARITVNNSFITGNQTRNAAYGDLIRANQYNYHDAGIIEQLPKGKNRANFPSTLRDQGFDGFYGESDSGDGRGPRAYIQLKLRHWTKEKGWIEPTMQSFDGSIHDPQVRQQMSDYIESAQPAYTNGYDMGLKQAQANEVRVPIKRR